MSSTCSSVTRWYSYGTSTLPAHNWNARLREAFTKQIRPFKIMIFDSCLGYRKAESLFFHECARMMMWASKSQDWCGKDGDITWKHLYAMKRRHNLEHFIYISQRWRLLKPLSVTYYWSCNRTEFHIYHICSSVAIPPSWTINLLRKELYIGHLYAEKFMAHMMRYSIRIHVC